MSVFLPASVFLSICLSFSVHHVSPLWLSLCLPISLSPCPYLCASLSALLCLHSSCNCLPVCLYVPLLASLVISVTVSLSVYNYYICYCMSVCFSFSVDVFISVLFWLYFFLSVSLMCIANHFQDDWNYKEFENVILTGKSTPEGKSGLHRKKMGVFWLLCI